MITFFKELFQYNNHFNKKLIDIFIENPEKMSDKSISVLNHMINAHQIWNSRIEPAQQTFEVWGTRPISELKSINERNYHNSIIILDTISLDAVFEYTNSKKQTFTNSVRDTLFHVINHYSYHRGQLALEFRQIGIEPLVTDYIFYKR
jgi:uncharacterized damage-inducible protein DinB